MGENIPKCKYCPMTAWVSFTTCYACTEMMLLLHSEQEAKTIKKKKRKLV